jgi:hypothetical protein
MIDRYEAELILLVKMTLILGIVFLLLLGVLPRTLAGFLLAFFLMLGIEYVIPDDWGGENRRLAAERKRRAQQKAHWKMGAKDRWIDDWLKQRNLPPRTAKKG